MTKAEWIKLLDAYDDDADITESDLQWIAREAALAHEELVERLEERQEQNGFYAFQDMMWNWRNER